MDHLEQIYKCYYEYLDETIGNNSESKKEILEKGQKIIRYLESLDKSDKKVLMVGQVQSGKTLNFMSVIANAILSDYKFIVVLSSNENELHKQTKERLNAAFNKNGKNINFLKILDFDKGNIEEDNFIVNLSDNEKNNHITIIVSLKNSVKINRLINIFSERIFYNKKILLIDDEGDLASLSSNKKEDSSTLKTLKEFFAKTNCSYVSVTATPQVHLMLEKFHEMIPKKVFCIQPGKGYKGMDIFNEKKYYKIIEETISSSSDFYKSNVFKECILYYFIAWTAMMVEKHVSINEHSNCLIHTNVRDLEHEKCKGDIKHISDEFKNAHDNKLDISYFNFQKNVADIIVNYDLPVSYIKNKEFWDFLEKSIRWCQVKIINQKNKDSKINEDLTSIVIGSKKLERGITLDNLITTFFTNRSKKGTAAIDTLLQRARWFGYRSNILDYMKIYTTDQIREDFLNIEKINNDIWKILQEAERDNVSFDELDTDIFVPDGSKLKPTNKIPLQVKKYRTQSSSFVRVLAEQNNKYLYLFDDLVSSSEMLEISDKYKFKCLSFNSISDFLQKYPRFKNVLNLDQKNLEILVNSEFKFKVCLLDDINNRNNPRTRSCINIRNEDMIKYVPQGRNGVEGSVEFYPGDSYWLKKNNLSNMIILQIHYIKPISSSNDLGTTVYAWLLLLPDALKLKESYSSIK